MVGRRDGMQRDSHERGLHDRPIGKRPVEVRGDEAGDPVPEGHVRRRRLLRLDRGDPPDRLIDGDRLPSEQQLAVERGTIELPEGQGHARMVATGPAPKLPGCTGSTNAAAPNRWRHG